MMSIDPITGVCGKKFSLGVENNGFWLSDSHHANGLFDILCVNSRICNGNEPFTL